MVLTKTFIKWAKEILRCPLKTPIFCVCNWPWWLSFELTHNILQRFKACLNYFEKAYHEKFYHISIFVWKIIKLHRLFVFSNFIVEIIYKSKLWHMFSNLFSQKYYYGELIYGLQFRYNNPSCRTKTNCVSLHYYVELCQFTNIYFW